MTGASDKKNHKRGNSITGDATTDNALMRLSIVLKEIAESTNNKKLIASDGRNLHSRHSGRKLLKSKKGVYRDGNIT